MQACCGHTAVPMLTSRKLADMSDMQLNRQLTAFSQWKKRQRKILRQLQPWLKQQGLYTVEAHNAIQQSYAALLDDNITVVVAGEFSRGKTELINSLFFHDFGRRLLPTDAGRTTMCPTEIFQEDKSTPYLRLLPIETRLKATSLQELRQDKNAWVKQRLNLANPEALASQLRSLTASREVPVEQAIRLGLYPAERAVQPSDRLRLVEIPRWRLAQINFPHPLLAKGLRILDTPGLNAVGNEPELTYETLPNAQAVLFVLGADTGVTRSDLAMWKQFIMPINRTDRRGLMVVLNKTDTLWDELRPEHEVEASIERQCQDVARVLDVGPDQVFAASALKGLVARIRVDHELEGQSGISRIEDYMSTVIVDNRRDLIMSEYTEHVRSALQTLENLVNARLKRSTRQATELAQLSNQSEAAITQMLRQTEREKQRYQASVDAYQDSRNRFKRQGQHLLATISLHSLDQVIEQARRQMSGAWTTYRLKEAMRILFEDINKRMELIGSQTQEMRRLVRTIYRRFETDHDFPPMQPSMFSIVPYQVELGLLHQEAEVFRNSARLVMTEQHFVISRYFSTIVRRVRKIFGNAREEAYQWLEHTLDPLTVEVKEHRAEIARQIDDLKHAGTSRKTIQQRLNTLQRDTERQQQQLKSLRNVSQVLCNPVMPNEQGKVQPTLVKTSPREARLGS